MYARVNFIFGTATKVGAGVAHIEKSDRDAVEAVAGNRGLTTLVDRKTGVIVAISYWDDLRLSSETALTKAREGAAEGSRGSPGHRKLRSRRRRTTGGARPGRDGADDPVCSSTREGRCRFGFRPRTAPAAPVGLFLLCAAPSCSSIA